jgi:hypothetical protein
MNIIAMLIDTATNSPDWEHIAWGTVKLIEMGHKKVSDLRLELKEMVATVNKEQPGFFIDSDEDIEAALKEIMIGAL